MAAADSDSWQSELPAFSLGGRDRGDSLVWSQGSCQLSIKRLNRSYSMLGKDIQSLPVLLLGEMPGVGAKHAVSLVTPSHCSGKKRNLQRSYRMRGKNARILPVLLLRNVPGGGARRACAGGACP